MRAVFDTNGLPLAFYSEEIHGDAIPAGAVAISEAQWREFIDHQGRRKWSNGEVVAYDPPPPPDPIPTLISRRQFFQGLAKPPYQIVTEAEAEDALSGAIPAVLQQLIDGLPPEVSRFDVRMLVKGATDFERAHPVTALIAQAFGWTGSQTDAFWTFCAAL